MGLYSLSQGVPVEVWSAWFAGGVPLLPFPCLRVDVLWLRRLQSLWATSAVSAALRGSSSSCHSWFWSFLILGHTFLTPSPLPLLPSLAVGWSWRLFFLALCLRFVLLASRVGCWLGVIEVFP